MVQARAMTPSGHPTGWYWYYPVTAEPAWDRNADYAPVIVYLDWWDALPQHGLDVAGYVFLSGDEVSLDLLALQGDFVGPLRPHRDAFSAE